MKQQSKVEKIPKEVHTAALFAIESGTNREAVDTANLVADKINEISYYHLLEVARKAAEKEPYEVV